MSAEPEIAMAACRPVELGEEERALVRKLPPDVPYPPIYPGSIIKQCRACGQDVYVGPKIQEQMQTRKVEIWCFLDAMKIQLARAAFGMETPMQNLGNPYQRR